MKKLLITIFLLLTACGGGSLEIASTQEALSVSRKVSVLCIGDSITAGSQYDPEDLGHPKVAWRAEFRQRVEDLYHVEVHLVGNEVDENPPSWWPEEEWHHAGVGGELVDDPRHLRASVLSIRQRVRYEIPKHQPDVVILFGGVNDLAVGYSPQEVIRHLRDTARDIRQKLPNTRIVIPTIVTILNKYQESIYFDELLLRSGPLFPKGTSIVEGAGHLIHPTDFAEDHLHPNRLGYERIGWAIAENFEKPLGEILEERYYRCPFLVDAEAGLQ